MSTPYTTGRRRVTPAVHPEYVKPHWSIILNRCTTRRTPDPQRPKHDKPHRPAITDRTPRPAITDRTSPTGHRRIPNQEYQYPTKGDILDLNLINPWVNMAPNQG